MSRKSLLGKKKKKAPKETARESVYFDEELEPVEVEMIPEDQLELTKAELDEEFTKTLTSLDPNQPPKITYFNFKNGTFESKPNNQHIAVHINHDGIIWSKKEKEELEKIQKDKEKDEEPQTEEKDEKEQNEDEDQDKENENEEEQKTENDDDDNKEEIDKEETKENEDDVEEEDKEEEEEEETEKKNEVLVKNQFNYSDRASQTFNEPLRDREVQTEPAPKSVFSQNANPSLIRDEYLNNLLKVKQQQIEEENKKKKSGFSATSSNTNRNESNDNVSTHRIKHHDEGDALLHSKAMLKALKIMERVAVLNANSESYHEFRYYKDSDYKRGSFLTNLWRFKYNCSGYKMVTCLEWNKSHLDLFGVGYGSYDFNQQTNGMICIYSLKSTAFPEKIIMCESGVMAMSFHPKYSSLICVGSYDGSVAVYDIRNRDDSPIYSSENPETHHSDPITDIKWYFDELQHDLVFYSISSDSEIKIWKMSQNELNHESFIKLMTPQIKKDEDTDDDNEEWGDDDMPALCSCFDFNPFMEHLYLVGTEDGHIMECNKTYNDGYTKIYKNAHFMNVYGVKWNPFHSKIFISCSEDWTIKLFEMETDKTDKDKTDKYEPIITYDLGCSVNDVMWSPFSSTIFCAVTNDGKLHIFDLSQNKNAPLCTQQITKKSKNIRLTKTSFPVGFPLVLVGDEKGTIYALKLSPNLYLNKVKHRDILKNISPTMFDNQDFKEKEKEKLINVLNVTGNKVFDVIQHFSPKIKKINIQSPKKK